MNYTVLKIGDTGVRGFARRLGGKNLAAPAGICFADGDFPDVLKNVAADYPTSPSLRSGQLICNNIPSNLDGRRVLFDIVAGSSGGPTATNLVSL